MKPRTIISVVDSPAAVKDAALARALSFAHWYDSDLHVVHVGPSGRATDDAIRNALVEHIALAVGESGTRGVNTTPAVLSGSAVRATAEYAGRVGADLVVVGKKARRSDGYWSTGSFAAALGIAVMSPTIAIPTRPAEPVDSGTPFRNILAAIDFSEASIRALSEALAIAQHSGGHLTLLHVLDGFPYESVYSGSQALGLMREYRAHAARVNRKLQALIPPDALNWSEIDVATLYGQPHQAILAAASDRRTDLIVLGLPRRPRLEQFVAGSTAHKVLGRASSPVLLVPGPSTVSLVGPVHEHDGQYAPYRSAFGLRAADTATATERRAS